MTCGRSVRSFTNANRVPACGEPGRVSAGSEVRGFVFAPLLVWVTLGETRRMDHGRKEDKRRVPLSGKPLARGHAAGTTGARADHQPYAGSRGSADGARL